MKLSLRASLIRMAYRSAIAIAAAILVAPMLGCSGDPETESTAAVESRDDNAITRCGTFAGAYGAMSATCPGTVTCDYSSGVAFQLPGFDCAVRIPENEKVTICVTVTCR